MNPQNNRWIIYGMFVVSLSISSAFGAGSLFCKQYAQRAVGQFYIAKFHKMPNINPPAWQGNYEAHKKWCELPFISEEMAKNEIEEREQYINQNNSKKNTSCNIKKIIFPDGKVKIKFPNGKVIDHTIKKRTNIILYSSVPVANMPQKPSNPKADFWLNSHAKILLNIIRMQVDNEEAFHNYMKFEGDELSVFKKIDSRSETINYLVSP